LSRPLAGAAKETLAAASRKSIPIVAVDIPSGVQGDTGENLGAVESVLTVTCFRKKPGHLFIPRSQIVRRTRDHDIGTPEDVLDEIAPKTFENDPGLWLAALPRPHRADNKYTRGHALISGGYPMTGAARMGARAAARVGAGLTPFGAQIALPIYAPPHRIMVKTAVGAGRFDGC